LKFESFARKTWFIKVLILRPKMLQKSPKSTFNFKIISGGYTPGLPLKGGRIKGEEREVARERRPIHIPGYDTGS